MLAALPPSASRLRRPARHAVIHSCRNANTLSTSPSQPQALACIRTRSHHAMTQTSRGPRPYTPTRPLHHIRFSRRSPASVIRNIDSMPSPNSTIQIDAVMPRLQYAIFHTLSASSDTASLSPPTPSCPTTQSGGHTTCGAQDGQDTTTAPPLTHPLSGDLRPKPGQPATIHNTMQHGKIGSAGTSGNTKQDRKASSGRRTCQPSASCR